MTKRKKKYDNDHNYCNDSDASAKYDNWYDDSNDGNGHCNNNIKSMNIGDYR